MNQKSHSCINLEQLHQISEGDIEFEIEILQVYVEDVSRRLEKVRDAIDNNDWSIIMTEAHHMKGSSGNVGAFQVESLAIQLEKLNHLQDAEAASKIINAMFTNIKAVELFIAEKSAILSSQKVV
jgi:HPt (histidine-containing phosphotransfer) domain-containing protein